MKLPETESHQCRYLSTNYGENIASGMGTQKMNLSLDFTSAVKTTADDKDFSSGDVTEEAPKKEEQKPSTTVQKPAATVQKPTATHDNDCEVSSSHRSES